MRDLYNALNSFFLFNSFCLIVFLFCLHFLSSKSFPNNLMCCEIIDCFNVFFVEIQLKKENLKSVFLAPKFGRPNRYTVLQNGLDTSLHTLIICSENPKTNCNHTRRYTVVKRSKQCHARVQEPNFEEQETLRCTIVYTMSLGARKNMYQDI